MRRKANAAMPACPVGKTRFAVDSTKRFDTRRHWDVLAFT
jgi:hypothetical protein